MFTKKQNIILFFLLCVGFIVALKLLHIDYMINYSSEPYKSFCNVNETFNCDAVAASPFSHLWSVPISLIGAWANLFLMIVLVTGHKLIQPILKRFFVYIFALYFLGCVALAVISFLFVPALCFVCMIYWGVSIATFVYLVLISKEDVFPLSARFLDALKVVQKKKILSGTLSVIFIVPLICAHFYFSRLGCDTVGSGAICCENYHRETREAFLGKKTGKLSVVLYTDFECPWCKRTNDYITELMKKYQKQIRFVRKDFPLDMSCNPIVKRPFHRYACLASYYSKCAGDQGKYWEYHDAVYENQKSITEEKFVEIAEELSLDSNDLRRCARSETIRDSVRSEIEEALFYDITGTPTFRIFCEILGTRVDDEIINDYLAHYPAITAKTLERIYDTKMAKYLQIVDIRNNEDFAKGHLDEAVNIPLESFKSRLSELQENIPVLICDERGAKSGKAFDILKNSGFEDVRTLRDGYGAWAKDMAQAPEETERISETAVTVIEAREAYELIQNNTELVIVDVRTKEEFDNSHIENAVNIPVEELAGDYALLGQETDKTLLIYCTTQNKSWTAARFLETKGFKNIVIMDEGIQKWVEAGYIR